ncbi:RNA polymerase sigma factor WhiG [Candidatus Desantisbacteria bacterium CG2_30_40_21]|uniref:RNA polymerase sigma factor n=5 Tax=unclassified Candidatus Desantisiibacteriota TaxID=3106372 RepID=A0A2M7JDI8_9BACT|nr:MAG: RNA polymerase sigma factor WhiG [Candidatus Desantisbacteria bacterium CG2_30_40_21]PIP39925.1 MAG: RNA polymerase sigma factor WhiG [Candidatus Desantisbacteria bacterium CG23_combo_of_CG06-09_8_20_14_all_40_23]PIX17474.1 MAG: RNA polymerase sigma factor WhiG [Candidatus Desantisbacteria bacterium CG_4_8_14_3_um_filter_40_12]PIY18634.1 MAG: RNA polymerase sigma factor WhiG [Candidatus Desantisbacteria bacterium CG_4_10_14_3_um_filter_40_18]PJB29104.1 MAG: RNA polymerase sigma factor W
MNMPAPKTEEELWQEYKRTKDPMIREELILMHASIVKYVAGRVAISMPPHVDFEDLLSYGILGLMDAIEKFDPNQGTKFRTYASTRIRGAIIDEIRHLDWVPRTLRQKAKALEDVYASLEYKLERSATDKEVAEAMNISMDELFKLIQEASTTTLVSLEDVWYLKDDSDEVTIMDMVESSPEKGPDVLAEKEDIRNILVDAIDKLPEREREIIALYYYDKLTLKEIGKVLNVTESRISQLHSKAILRLRGYLTKMNGSLL